MAAINLKKIRQHKVYLACKKLTKDRPVDRKGSIFMPFQGLACGQIRIFTTIRTGLWTEGDEF